MATCKGHKKDGTPCQSSIVLDNGYCRAHQDQAPEEVRWTRERLESAIAAHGGPEGLDLAGADLSHLDLSGIALACRWEENGRLVFSGVNLQGATLWFTNLQGAYLPYCNLQGADLQYANLRETTLWSTNLQEANLLCTDLQDTDLQNTDLRRTKLFEANLQGADLRGTDLREIDLLDVKAGGVLGIKLYRAKLDHTRLKKEQLGTAIGDEQVGEYREARDAYLALKQNFEGLGDYEAASWAYIKERKMEKACSALWRARRFYGVEQLGDTWLLDDIFKHKLPAYHPRVWWFFTRHFFKWLGDWVVEVLCGYGESIGRVLWWMAVLLFGSPLLFGLLGLLDWPKANYDVFFSLPVPRRYGYAYVQQFLYVLDAFTTADFAELEPANSLGRLCSGFIALVGIFLTGLLGFVAGNRIRRS